MAQGVGGEEMKTFVYKTRREARGEAGRRCGATCAAPGRRGGGGSPGRGADSSRHGAGKRRAERWSRFNEEMLL